MNYPTKAELDLMGATLQKDVALCSDELQLWFHGAHTKPVYTRAEKPIGAPRSHHKLGGKRIA